LFLFFIFYSPNTTRLGLKAIADYEWCEQLPNASTTTGQQ